jgi:uncharacterized protein
VLALLDVNVLIALFDVDHSQHSVVRGWLEKNIHHGWASCPLTQNGLIRIMSQRSYPRYTTTHDMAQRMRDATATASHKFIADNISLTDSQHIRIDRLLTPSALTDIYLLALAVKHDSRFVTLDKRISSEAVIAARLEHLVVL